MCRLEKMSGGSSDGENLYSSGVAFRAFNKSKSGSLSHKELGAGLSQLKIKHKDDVTSLRRLLDRMDIDRDGKVSDTTSWYPILFGLAVGYGVLGGFSAFGAVLWGAFGQALGGVSR